MEIKLEVPEYDPNEGFKYKWVKGFEIEIKVEKDTIFFKANKEGLISMANHFMNIAQDTIPAGYHIHLDDYNSLEEGSSPIIIQKS
ncbi:Imm32 family immunity protein [Sabulibacter ruber]|uniref:Imm32 family immunity protein n=1 Tax=Sabulibacter ruber TaxID=2811901 RepID=UPI001A96266D|nr:hypothetical protein [Sabulibacter ruber]